MIILRKYWFPFSKVWLVALNASEVNSLKLLNYQSRISLFNLLLINKIVSNKEAFEFQTILNFVKRREFGNCYVFLLIVYFNLFTYMLISLYIYIPYHYIIILIHRYNNKTNGNPKPSHHSQLSSLGILPLKTSPILKYSQRFN